MGSAIQRCFGSALPPSQPATSELVQPVTQTSFEEEEDDEEEDFDIEDLKPLETKMPVHTGANCYWKIDRPNSKIFVALLKVRNSFNIGFQTGCVIVTETVQFEDYDYDAMFRCFHIPSSEFKFAWKPFKRVTTIPTPFPVERVITEVTSARDTDVKLVEIKILEDEVSKEY